MIITSKFAISMLLEGLLVKDRKTQKEVVVTREELDAALKKLIEEK